MAFFQKLGLIAVQTFGVSDQLEGFVLFLRLNDDLRFVPLRLVRCVENHAPTGEHLARFGNEKMFLSMKLLEKRTEVALARKWAPERQPLFLVLRVLG